MKYRIPVLCDGEIFDSGCYDMFPIGADSVYVEVGINNSDGIYYIESQSLANLDYVVRSLIIKG